MSKILVHYKTKGKINSLKEFNNSIKELQTRKKIKKLFFINEKKISCLIGKINILDSEFEELKINNLILESLFLEIVGNIYNYGELKKIIEENCGNLGKVSKEKIIGLGYKLLGLNFFEKINGEFAIVIYDKIKKKLICIRDRFGTNLIFFTKFQNNIFLSSEIKSFFKFSCVKKEPNWVKLKTFLFKNYRYSFGDESTFFKDIYLVAPNSINIWTESGYKKKTLWNYKIKDNSKLTVQSAEKKFLKLLEESFKLREDSVAENNKAFLVSGGLDSPTVATLASMRSNKRKIGYSICYEYKKNSDELYYDESELIKKIIQKNNMEWRPIFLNSNHVKSNIDEIFDSHDEPISAPTWISHYILAKEIFKDKIDFLFGGDGGDHALAGIYDDFPYYFADLQKKNKIQKLNKELKYWQLKHDHPIFKKINPCGKYTKKIVLTFPDLVKLLIIHGMRKKMRNLTYYKNLQGKYFKKIKFLNPKFPSVSKSYLKSKLWQDLVHTSSPPSSRSEAINFGSMGIDLRSIFLDKRFMEFCWSLPGEFMIKNGNSKFIMRHAMRNKLPKAVVENKKHVGFNAPANIWFRGFLKKDLINSINALSKQNYELLNKEVINKMLNNHFQNKTDNMMILWKFYSVSKWLEKWKF